MRSFRSVDPELAERYRGTPGTGGRLRWLYAGVWLLYLVGPIINVCESGRSPLWIAVGLVLAGMFLVIYMLTIVGMRYGRLGDRWPYLGFGLLVTLAFVLCLLYRADWIATWIYVGCAAGATVRGRVSARLTILGVGASYTLCAWLLRAGTSSYLAMLLPTLLTGVMMMAFRRQMDLMFELALARRTVARLAANEERLRLARDLHDLTGHSLSTITLKTELARRLLEAAPPSKQRDAAIKELADVEAVSREALHDIRDAVSGYRQPTLAVELETARAGLGAAGVRLDAGPEPFHVPEGVDPALEAVLAWCLREAVTNVVRHAGARVCRVRLVASGGELSLVVSDDGRGLRARDVDDPPGRDTHGNGLHGMTERLDAVGGRLTVGARPGGGFELVAAVPTASTRQRHQGRVVADRQRAVSVGL